MALSQRLQIRQSQALVMTPQLMQAIKLLQLSNLDLVAYVEAELERNPLLDRGAETEAAAERAGRRPIAGPAGRGRRGAERQRRPRPAIGAGDERRETPLDDTSPDEAEPIRPRSCGHAGGLFGMGRRRLRRPRRRRLQSRSLRLRRDHAGGLAARAAHARDCRSGAAHDRPISDRSGRRGRLSRPAISPRRRKSSAPASPRSRPCSPSCKPSIRPAFARAISPNAWRSSSRNTTATIRRCRR